MASSNRHWPSMFKSKPCNQPWQDITSPPVLSTPCHKSPYNSAGCEERTPEPKPRWNPKPEQIRILETIFNSGMVNPPREEIRKIRIQLQQFGQVGDANVFYWFQNRKSRTKNKHRHLLSARRPSVGNGTNTNANPTSNGTNSASTKVNMPIAVTAPTSTSSSSSEMSSGSSKPLKPVHAPITFPEPVSMYNNFHCSMEPSSLPEPFFYQNPHGYCFAIPELTGLIATPPNQFSGAGLGVWSEPMGNSCAVNNVEEAAKRKHNADLSHASGLSNELLHHEGYKGFVGGESLKIELHQHQGCSFQPTGTVSVVASTAAAETVVTAAVPAASGAADIIVTCGASASATTVASCPVNVIQGLDNIGGCGGGVGRCTVFINDMACEVAPTPLNVNSVFGPNAILLHPSGYPVPVDEFNNTLQPLQHGGSYYLVGLDAALQIAKEGFSL